MGVIASDSISLISTADIYNYSSKAIGSTTQLWFTNSSTVAPAKPVSEVTSDSTDPGAWRVVVPAYDDGYPYYFYCFQYEFRDGTFAWTEPVYDLGTTESQMTANDAHDIATSKARTFTDTPTTPYAIGDTWIDVHDGRGRAPEGYVEVSNIVLKADGGLDLGFKVYKTDKIEAKWKWIGPNEQYVYYTDDESIPSTAAHASAYLAYDGAWKWGNRTINLSPSIQRDYVSVQDMNGVTLDGETESYEVVQPFNTSYNLLVGDLAGSVLYYYIKVWNSSNTLTHHFIPIRNDDSSLVGLYDIVTDTVILDDNADTTIDDCGKDAEVPHTLTWYAKVARASGNFNPNDWELAATDDSNIGAIAVSEVVKQYANSSSTTVPPLSDAWSTTVPDIELGMYLWSREQLTYADGSVAYTDPVCVSVYTTDIVRPEVDNAIQVATTYAAGLVSNEHGMWMTSTAKYDTQISDLISQVSENTAWIGTNKGVIEGVVTAEQVTTMIDDTTGAVTSYVVELEKYIEYDAVDGLILSANNSAVKTVLNEHSWTLTVNGTAVQQVDAENGAMFSSLSLKKLDSNANNPTLVLGKLTIVVEDDNTLTGKKTG